MENKLNILIVSLDESLKENIKTSSIASEFDLNFLVNAKAIVDVIKSNAIKILIIDLDKQKIDELNILTKVKETDPQVEVIFIGKKSIDSSCVEAVNKGAYDYITKPITAPELSKTLKSIHEKIITRHEIGELEYKLFKKYEFQDMIGRSPQMLDVFSFIQRISKHPTTVLITGETGTGKELTAKALHNLSKRKKKKFVTCNCAALADTLLESELFGHVKGAFTGAIQTKYGLFEYGDQGTIFLDEIGDISLSTQTKLLRVLENREIQRVGSIEKIKIDIRLISATNKNLENEIIDNKFREDFYYRLNVIQIHIPPLRDRKEDIPLLSNYLIRKCNKKHDCMVRGISQPAKKLLMNHSWPGNIRELENVIERAVSLTTKNFISEEDLPPNITKSRSRDNGSKVFSQIDGNMTLEEVESQYIKKIMDKTGGNKMQAAKLLGLSRRSLYRKLEKLT